MELRPEGEEKVLLGKDAKTVVRYRVKLELGGLTGLVAPMLGKQPPDLHYWLVTGDVRSLGAVRGSYVPAWPGLAARADDGTVAQISPAFALRSSASLRPGLSPRSRAPLGSRLVPGRRSAGVSALFGVARR